MSITATVKAGKIVLPPGTPWPTGTRVRIEAVAEDAPSVVMAEKRLLTPEEDPFLAAVQKLAKARPHLPKDYALNHGHYIHGTPKK
jgi:hypothetical protein